MEELQEIEEAVQEATGYETEAGRNFKGDYTLSVQLPNGVEDYKEELSELEELITEVAGEHYDSDDIEVVHENSSPNLNEYYRIWG